MSRLEEEVAEQRAVIAAQEEALRVTAERQHAQQDKLREAVSALALSHGADTRAAAEQAPSQPHTLLHSPRTFYTSPYLTPSYTLASTEEEKS